MQNQIIYSNDECNCKSQLINLILKCVFKSHIPKVKPYQNSNTLLTPNGDCEFPKKFTKNHHQNISCNSYTHDNRFHALCV